MGMKKERSSKQAMRIGEVARAAGVNIQTLRYYERRGLLPSPDRNEGGHREYSAETIRLIRFIKGGQELGFTLKEVEELLHLRKQQGRSRSSVQQLAAAKVEDVDSKIRHLRQIRKALHVLLESCQCSRAELECPILEALDEPQKGKRGNGH